jgi:superfamily II DNA/RNA helicase
MPEIYDNIEQHLSRGLIETLEDSHRSDFCVGYFNLRGWKHLESYIENFKGGEDCCRLLVGMQRPEEEILKQAIGIFSEEIVDNQLASEIKKSIARSFRKQLTFGVPNDADEAALKKLKNQLIEGKVKVKLFLKHPLHAKLYLLFRSDRKTPIIGYVGSSNLTLSGLSKSGELNVDVVEQDAANKLSDWFENRWDDRWCIDISEELIEILEESWAGEELIPPYHIYLKVAYHLSQEARSGISNYIVPKALQDILMPFQENAVSVAARHLDKRGGVLIGDVVGLGKTLTATAVAKLFEETFFTETLIICPKNLKEMWEDYVHQYRLRARVKSISKVREDFVEETRRYRVVIIDESHNLRNRESKRYGYVKEYIEQNESRVILLTATPYNKSYLDISNQLRLFIPEDQDLGISPEKFIESVGGPIEFVANYQYSPTTILAFEKSEIAEDWQELLKMYMVRRTRTFIKDNYAIWDEDKQQYYIEFKSGEKNYFPDRLPKKVEYSFDEDDPTDQYVRLYSDKVVDTINNLHLARYGLGNYIDPDKAEESGKEEELILENLSRAGKRLMGFCRTNLFKRLESSGFSFLISLARHVQRNYLFIHAIENELDLPIGRQETADMNDFIDEKLPGEDENTIKITTDSKTYEKFGEREYKDCLREEHKYRWISADFFDDSLKDQLLEDSEAILGIIKLAKDWDPQQDRQLNALEDLIQKTHAEQKLIVFTQFTDTANYLHVELKKRGVEKLEIVTGDSENPTKLAQRFSPKSNNKKVDDELRVLISTDVLSEGQNLQDSNIIVNYDLPWALIRLIQRAGRVDRIGQKADQIYCYSFLPQDGLNKIIRLRDRLQYRIKQNAEVVGADETFFDGDPVNIEDLYNERSGIFDEDEGEVDLTSQAYEIWQKAIENDPSLKKVIPEMPDVVYATKPVSKDLMEKDGVITYHKNSNGFEVLTWLDGEKKVVSQGQSRILKALECEPDTEPQEKLDVHHDLVSHAVEIGEKEAKKAGGQLGSKASARYKVYNILNRYYEGVKQSLFDTDQLKKTIDDIYKYPLRERARDIINKRIRLGTTDEEMAELCMQLRDEGRLCIIDPNEEKKSKEPHIICSMGLKAV